MLLYSMVYRIGLQSLLLEDGLFYVSIKNRTYYSKARISDCMVPLWIEMLTNRECRI